MTARERVARVWHAGSDHAKDGSPFGGPLCNCWRVAGRIMPMLDHAWTEGWAECYEWLQMAPASQPEPTSPYEAEEAHHVDQ
ncbi:hypothetical protein NCCP2495_05600 [Dietzia sp. NCCP-2495]|uniref:hypothetical protein n=1 Tax=Dietzia sp. NCCP-2495 TaxID=2934675 RepID=UPI00222E6417|nr:hypothetical protein [Dietzia sp. NCCP-2495]GLB62682.1 hypothetical protein NCCP2495_05600 [Dietzia sp. NCCP-2495]